MTNRVRSRIHKKYPNIETALVDWHDGLWEVVLLGRKNRLKIDSTPEEIDIWAGINDDLVREFDEILTYFLTDMSPQWRSIVAKAHDKQRSKKKNH